MSAPALRCVIVDDEPLARRRLRAMLGAHADIEIVAECEDAAEAVRTIRELKPDIAFLDIQLPGTDGFGVLDEAQITPAPFVVFVTAFAQHAVRAFDASAGDYLLKPFDAARLARSLGRAREVLAKRRAPDLAAEVRALVDTLRPADAAPRYLERVAVTIGHRTLFIRTDDVDWIEASGNYACFHTGGHKYLVRTTLAALEAQLDPADFARIHRSAIVRIDRVRELRSPGYGDYTVVLMDGTALAMGQRYRGRLGEQ